MQKLKRILREGRRVLMGGVALGEVIDYLGAWGGGLLIIELLIIGQSVRGWK